MSQLFCPVRKSWVAALPEERVRQALLAQMIQQLGYPPALLVIEKGLPNGPNRRADLICYGKEDSNLFPLLLIECKAVPLTGKALNQLMGYNAHLKARYVALANQNQVKTGWYDPLSRQYKFIERLPAYSELKVL